MASPVTVFPLFPLLIFALGGCMSLVEKTGRLADGSAFAEKTLAEYRGAGVSARRALFQEKEEVRIALDAFPYIEFAGSKPDADGAFEFTGLRYSGGTGAGWNEWNAETAGKGAFRLSGNTVYLNLRGTLEIVTLVKAKILHNTGKRGGEEALAALKNRFERVNALAAEMRVLADRARFSSIKAFSAYWEPILLPELVSAKKRPALWKKEGKIEWARAEDISWNSTYTKAVFPEALWAFRDSGALLRDWEEALPWIYCIYEWDFIEDSLREVIMTAR
jgi:hypothetical protein